MANVLFYSCTCIVALLVRGSVLAIRYKVVERLVPFLSYEYPYASCSPFLFLVFIENLTRRLYVLYSDYTWNTQRWNFRQIKYNRFTSFKNQCLIFSFIMTANTMYANLTSSSIQKYHFSYTHYHPPPFPRRITSRIASGF